MIKYISRNYRGTTYAGTKAKSDIEKIMEGMGYKNIGSVQTRYTNKIASFFSTLASIMRSVRKINEGDIIVLQYPLKKYFSFICKTAHLRKAKVIVLIHDLGSFRRKKLSVKQEIKRLQNADYIIAHSPQMKQWLENHSINRPAGILGLFDFLDNSEPKHICLESKPVDVIYVGGLSPKGNRFLYTMTDNAKNWRALLYGNGFDASLHKETNKELIHKGYIDSSDLIKSPQGNFGLVFYGDTPHTVGGEIGDYVKLIAPHKTSLYLRCGMPVIVWKQSAIAPIIEANNAGITVESLDEIDAIIGKMTIDDYNTMALNAYNLGVKLAAGEFTRKALSEAVDRLNDGKVTVFNQ